MKTSNLKKALALFLVLMLSLSSVSLLASAASGYTPTGDFFKISETEHKIAPGISENRVIVNKTSGDQQEVVYAVTVDAAAKATTSIMTGYKDYDASKWGMQTVRLQADKASKKLVYCAAWICSGRSAVCRKRFLYGRCSEND